MDDLYASCLGSPLPSESDFRFSEDRLFQIETEFARSLEHYSTPNSDQDGTDIEAILEPDSLLVDDFQEESPLSLPSTVPGEEATPIDLLLMGVEAVDARKWEVASGIITRLNLMLPRKENGDAPFDRLVFYFTKALDLRCLDNIRGMPNVAGPRMEIAAGGRNTTPSICAFLMVQELSPYIKFAHFTANQAILEATWSDRDVHVVDFDIAEGIQWPSLMADLAAREGGCSLHITAVIIANPGDAGHVSCTGRRLKEFAGSISLDFEFHQLVITKEEDFLNVKIDCGQTVVANCMCHQVHTPDWSRAKVRTFLNGVTTFVSPKVLVLVQDELHSMTKETANVSFVDFFCEALRHYMSFSESLASGFGCGYETWLKLVEKEILGSRIVDCLRGFPGEEDMGESEPGLYGYGLSPISEKNVAQAKFLVGLFCRDYWVQHEKGRRTLSLCWRSRPMVTASIWAPIQPY